MPSPRPGPGPCWQAVWELRAHRRTRHTHAACRVPRKVIRRPPNPRDRRRRRRPGVLRRLLPGERAARRTAADARAGPPGRGCGRAGARVAARHRAPLRRTPLRRPGPGLSVAGRVPGPTGKARGYDADNGPTTAIRTATTGTRRHPGAALHGRRRRLVRRRTPAQQRAGAAHRAPHRAARGAGDPLHHAHHRDPARQLRRRRGRPRDRLQCPGGADLVESGPDHPRLARHRPRGQGRRVRPGGRDQRHAGPGRDPSGGHRVGPGAGDADRRRGRPSLQRPVRSPRVGAARQ